LHTLQSPKDSSWLHAVTTTIYTECCTVDPWVTEGMSEKGAVLAAN